MKLSAMLPAVAAGVMPLLGAGAQAALPGTWQVTIEAPGVQIGPSEQYFDSYGTETFNGWAPDWNTGNTFYANKPTDFGSNGVITGTYHNVYARNADEYGGSSYESGNGSGTDYAVAGLYNSQKSYSLTLNDTQSDNGNVNYFGFWLSALDANNTLTFRDNGISIGSFTTADVLALVTGMPDYWGNPVPGQFYGDNSKEPYVFINFLDLGGPGFDEIIFSEAMNSNAGYESDNHTVGWFNTVINPGGLCDVNPDCTIVPPPSAVPEPATWAMMIAGFGLVGATMRRRQRVAPTHA